MWIIYCAPYIFILSMFVCKMTALVEIWNYILSTQYLRQAWVITIDNYRFLVLFLTKLLRYWCSMGWMIYKRQLQRWIVNVSRQNGKWCKHLNMPIFHPQILIWETSQSNIRLFFFELQRVYQRLHWLCIAVIFAYINFR